jgi:hypothetical protein
MIPDPAYFIKREVLQLIDLQIETLKQDSLLDSPQTRDYRVRSDRIQQLYAELDRIGQAGRAFKIALKLLWNE